MIRILLIGYCFGIRSERRLCDELHLNLAYRWFCRLGLDGALPDRSTFSKNRHGRFRQSDLFRRVFESVLHRCIKEHLVGGEGFAVDAGLIKADANRQNEIEGDKGLPQNAAGRAIDGYLAVLDDAAFGPSTEVTPKFVSPSDSAARWTVAHGGQAFFAYSTNYVVDVENAIIVDVEATTAIRQAEVLAAKCMIERSLKTQIELAKEYFLPTMIHTPHREKRAGTLRTMDVLKEHNFDPARCVIDHNNEGTIHDVFDRGYWCAFSIYPQTKWAANAWRCWSRPSAPSG